MRRIFHCFTKLDRPPNLFFLLDERIGDLLAAVGWRNQHNQSAAGDDETKGAGSFISFVI